MKTEKIKRRVAARLTPLDQGWIDAAQKTGFIGVDERGRPYLEGDQQITLYRLRRLETLGIIEPNKDSLFIGGPPQTFRLKLADT